MHFDEKSMFAGHKMEAKTLKVKPKALTHYLSCHVWRSVCFCGCHRAGAFYSDVCLFSL